MLKTAKEKCDLSRKASMAMETPQQGVITSTSLGQKPPPMEDLGTSSANLPPPSRRPVGDDLMVMDIFGELANGSRSANMVQKLAPSDEDCYGP